jgi:hypothetical protein
VPLFLRFERLTRLARSKQINRRIGRFDALCKQINRFLGRFDALRKQINRLVGRAPQLDSLSSRLLTLVSKENPLHLLMAQTRACKGDNPDLRPHF